MYYLSLLSQFKNETMNLKNWLDHYLWQGVQHFYLIDNGSTDNPLNILQGYINKGIVSYFYRPQNYQQVENYRWVFDYVRMKRKTYWLIICDLDEFFYGVDRCLKHKLRTLEYYDFVYANWLMFGSSGHVKHPPDIRKDIVHRLPNIDAINTKYIFKPLAIRNSSQIWIHWLFYPRTNIPIKSGKRVKTANKLIRLNHYVIQSKEYYQKVKMIRGDAVVARDNNKHNMTFFNTYDLSEIYVDNTLKKIVENYHK